MKRYMMMFLFMILTVFAIFIVPVSAQDIDISDMDNALLMELLQSIMQKLNEPEEEIPTPTPTAIPTPTATPEPIPDVSQIDNNEQLLALMQAIMQKLEANENGGSAATPETESAVQELVVTLIPESIPESIIEEVQHEIYENKKLILERIPDDRFIQKPNGKHEKTPVPGTKDKGDEIWDDDVESCPPGLFWDCTPERCMCISPNG